MDLYTHGHVTIYTVLCTQYRQVSSYEMLISTVLWDKRKTFCLATNANESVDTIKKIGDTVSRKTVRLTLTYMTL